MLLFDLFLFLREQSLINKYIVNEAVMWTCANCAFIKPQHNLFKFFLQSSVVLLAVLSSHIIDFVFFFLLVCI